MVLNRPAGQVDSERTSRVTTPDLSVGMISNSILGSSDFRSLNTGVLLVSVKEIRVFDSGKALTGLVVNTASIEDVLTPG